MDNIILSFLFNRRKKLNNRGQGGIDLKIFKNRNEYKFKTTSIYIEPKFWDSKNQLVKKSHPDSITLNSNLDEYRERHRLFIDEINRRKNGFHMADLSRFTENKNSRACFIAYMESEIARRAKNDLTPSTVRAHTNKLNNLKKFRKTILFDEIDVRLIEDYHAFLQEQVNPSNDSETIILKHNTLKNNHKTLSTYLNRAVRDKLLSPADFPYGKGKFSMRWHETATNYLKPSQIKALEKYKAAGTKYEKVKDAFLFSCYTGLRHIDYSQLSYENFSIDDNGRITLKYIPQKIKRFGNKEHIVPLYKLFPDLNKKSTRPEQIILKYMKKYSEFKEDQRKEIRQFFKMSDQKMNEYIKEMFPLAGIKFTSDVKCSTHLGRHTFGTLMCNDLNIPVTVVKELMCHGDINQTMKYVVMNDRIIGSVLDSVKWESI